MNGDRSRPPRAAVALFLVGVFGVGGWLMAHTYDEHDPGICGGRYARARTAADSAIVDRFVPDSERDHLQPRPCGLLRGPTAQEFARADSLLSRAIAATGGDSALTHLTTIRWKGTAIPGDSAEAVTGTWSVVPPDSEVVTTWRAADSAATRRRVVVTPSSVWGESNGDSIELTPAERSAERQQVYGYGLLRLVSLREPGTLLWPLAADSAGRPGVLVRKAGHLDVALYFGADGRVAVMRTTEFPAPGAPSSTSTVTLAGTTEIAGVRWFREMRITRDGAPVAELTITAARPDTMPASSWPSQGSVSNP